jgi:signal peptidase I
VLVALNLILLNTLLFGRLYSVTTGSMEPTMAIGDQVFVSHRLFSGSIQRGDVIMVRYPVDPTQLFFKRVVGMPGDRLKLVDKDLWLNGRQVNEPYVQHVFPFVEPYRDNFPSAPPQGPVAPQAIEMLQHHASKGELVVPPGRYFLLGDNRDNSLDSRYWGFATDAEWTGRPVLVIGNGKSNFLRYPL